MVSTNLFLNIILSEKLHCLYEHFTSRTLLSPIFRASEQQSTSNTLLAPMIITGAEDGTASPAGRLEINITAHSFNKQWHCKTTMTYSKHLQVGQQVYSNCHDKKPNKNNKYYYAEEIQYSAQNHNVTLTSCSAHHAAFIKQLHWNVHQPPFPLSLTAKHICLIT